jgi:hypothetical protein
MRIVPRFCLVLGLAVLAAGPAAAQFFGGNLIHNQSVQEELKLTKDQVQKIQSIPQKTLEKHQKDMTALRKEGQTLYEKQRKLSTGRTEDTAKAMVDLLKPEQVKRLKEIETQARGLEAFSDASIQKTLALTDEQKDAIKTLSRELAQTVGKLRSEAFRDPKKYPTLQDDIAAATKEAEGKVVAKMTADQKKSWKKMAGDAFKGATKFASTGFGFNNATFTRIQMLLDDAVQKELKANDEQKPKFLKVSKDIQDKYKEKTEKVTKELNAYYQKTNSFYKKVAEESAKGIAAVLKPEQAQRLKEIEIQQLGIGAFDDADVQKQLKLTADQKKDIKAIRDDLRKEISKVYAGIGGDRTKLADARKKEAALTKEAKEKMVGKLTADQTKTWKKMVGAPFELKVGIGPLPGGGGGKTAADK